MKTELTPRQTTPAPTSWDIFCRVIDNHGDLGVCWRLCVDLAQRGHAVRLWVDDAAALSWMAPAGYETVQVMDWQDHAVAKAPHDVVVEAFGCEIPDHFQALIGQSQHVSPNTVWVNLEYLSAEAYVARQHGLPSPVMHGPARGAIKWFFYPGFTHTSGGLLRELDLEKRQARFDKSQWLQQWAFEKPVTTNERLMSLFCYEPEPLKAFLQQLAQDEVPTRLLVTAGRAQQAVRSVLPSLRSSSPALTIETLPYLTQIEFDHLLWACDLNFVRGEDSLVRAIWSGKPWVWQIYPQDDLAHHTKLQALCKVLEMPVDLHDFQLRWNQIDQTSLAQLSRAKLTSWGVWSQKTSLLLSQQSDLTSQLIEFTAQKR